MQTRIALALAAAAPLLWAPAQSSAQDFMSRDFIAQGTETWIIDLGGIVNRFDSTLRLNGQNSRGTMSMVRDRSHPPGTSSGLSSSNPARPRSPKGALPGRT